MGHGASAASPTHGGEGRESRLIVHHSARTLGPAYRLAALPVDAAWKQLYRASKTAGKMRRTLTKQRASQRESAEDTKDWAARHTTVLVISPN